MPPKLNHGGQFAAFLIGAADGPSGSVVDSEHAGTLHEIARRGGDVPLGLCRQLRYNPRDMKPKHLHSLPAPSAGKRSGAPRAGARSQAPRVETGKNHPVPACLKSVRATAAASKPGSPDRKAAETTKVPKQDGMGLHTAEGLRNYVTAVEREAFLREAERADRLVRTLCMTLAYAGCRLSEALALTAERVDLAAGVLTFESLKKRRAGVYRSVPVPPLLLDALDLVHGVRERQASRGKGRAERLWPWSWMTGWRAVHAVMQSARLDGAARLAQGAAARLWRRRRHRRHSAQPGAEVARPRPAHHHGDLRQRRRRRGEGHRPAHVGMSSTFRGYL